MRAVLDISRPIEPGMRVYAAEEAFTRSAMRTIERDGYRLTRLNLHSHLGTHMDAPAHFIPDGQTIDAVPLSLLLGEAYVATMRPGGKLPDFPEGTARLLLRGVGDQGLSRAQAADVVRRGARLLGVDSLSVAPEADERAVHVALMEAGVWIIENLALDDVKDGLYELCCLPLPIRDGDGAPVRAVLR